MYGCTVVKAAAFACGFVGSHINNKGATKNRNEKRKKNVWLTRATRSTVALLGTPRKRKGAERSSVVYHSMAWGGVEE